MNREFGGGWRWFGAGGVTLAVLVASCSSGSDVTSGGGGGHGGSPSAQGGSLAGGNSRPQGSAGRAGTGGNGGGSAGADSGLGGAAQAGASGSPGADGGTSDSAGAAGAAGEAAGGDCALSSDCTVAEKCLGGTLEQRCVAPNLVCTQDSDCHAYEHCAANGACVLSAGLGEACSPGFKCAYSGTVENQLYCDTVTRTCLAAPTQDLCSRDCDLYGCADGEACGFNSMECSVPICVRTDIFGEVCSYSQQCPPGGKCQALPQTGIPHCIAPTALGGPCAQAGFTYFCGLGAHCEVSDDSYPGICVASPGEGEDCLPADSPLCATATDCNPCAAGLYCASGKCTHEATVDEDCSTRACADPLRCVAKHVGGTCG